MRVFLTVMMNAAVAVGVSIAATTGVSLASGHGVSRWVGTFVWCVDGEESCVDED